MSQTRASSSDAPARKQPPRSRRALEHAAQRPVHDPLVAGRGERGADLRVRRAECSDVGLVHHEKRRRQRIGHVARGLGHGVRAISAGVPSVTNLMGSHKFIDLFVLSGGKAHSIQRVWPVVGWPHKLRPASVHGQSGQLTTLRVEETPRAACAARLCGLAQLDACRRRGREAELRLRSR